MINTASANGKLLSFLGATWLAFALVGLLIAFLLPIPAQIVLVDRSYCTPEQWGQLSQAYGQLYQEQQQKKIRLQPLIYFSSVGEETVATLPTPAEFARLDTFGRPDATRSQALLERYPQARLLSCSPP